jgi:hypothetical protein
MSAPTVTFQTVLDIARETPKAYKILTGNYLPKSQVQVEVLWEEDRAPHYGAKKLVAVQHVRVTMPKWLAER